MDERKLIEDFVAYAEQMPPMKNRSTTPADMVEGFFTQRYGEIVHAVGGVEARARGSEPSLHVGGAGDLSPNQAHELGASIVRWSGRRMAEQWAEKFMSCERLSTISER